MEGCIFTAHCIEPLCDKSCATFAEVSYLLERNNVSATSSVFIQSEQIVERVYNLLTASKNSFAVFQAKDTVQLSEMLTYCAICEHWKGSRLHCDVYHLRFSKYIEDIKRSWSYKKDTVELEYARIWINKCSVLIISNVDYLYWGDFECQTLLNIIQDRRNKNSTTIVVTPDITTLKGKGTFYPQLQKILSEAVVK